MRKRCLTAIVVLMLTCTLSVAVRVYADTTVYITQTGKKYHRDGCLSLRRSRIPVSLIEAKKKGYVPCSVCQPPR